MKPAAERLWKKYYSYDEHAYNIYERKIEANLSKEFTILDAGCGATAPVLTKFVGRCRKTIGVDLVPFQASQCQGVHLLQNDLANIDLESSSVDLVISRSVFEHIPDVESVYKELSRVLKPGGKLIILVPNLWDYISIASYLIPNSLHKLIVEKASGRPGEDVFATYYKSNTKRSIARLAQRTGFAVSSFDYLGQYPYMCEFNPLVFRMGIYYDKLVCSCSFLDFLRGWILCQMEKVSR